MQSGRAASNSACKPYSALERRRKVVTTYRIDIPQSAVLRPQRDTAADFQIYQSASPRKIKHNHELE
jgi:hypothetical protein